MNTNTYTKLAVVCLVVAVAGCGGGSSSNNGGDIGTQEAGPAAVSWYSTAQPLIKRYCQSCHTEGSLIAPFPLDTYEQVYNKRSAIAFTLESNSMPPLRSPDLSDQEAQLLQRWITDGAPLGDESQAQVGFTDEGYTYHGDTRAIIEEHCVGCHVVGGVAPFPLDSYERVKGAAAAVESAVENGSMPPWPPTKGYSRFVHERVIDEQDRFKLLNWLAGDLTEGSPADYEPPVIDGDPGEVPDFNINVKLPQPYTPTQRPDDHRCFAIDWPLDEFSYVRAVDVIPDQIEEVHHVIVNIIDPKDVHHYLGLDGEGGNPGWPCLLSGGAPGAPLPRQIGGWVPGTPSGAAPEGTGIGIHPDSLLVVQMHYNTLVAEPTPDQSTILIATVPEVQRPSSGFLFTDPNWLNPGGMPIPAGDPDVHHVVQFPANLLALAFGAPAGVRMTDTWAMHTGFLHMHNLATSGRTTLVRADGTEQVILDIRDWDFNWQSTYGLQRELLVKPSDKIRLECTWDNTDENQVLVNGEQRPARYVEWGDGTGDEMCLMSILMTVPDDDYDYSYHATVHIDAPSHRQKFQAGDLVPLELLFNNFTLEDPGEHTDDEHQHDLGQEHVQQEDDHSSVYEGHYHVYLDTDDDNAEHLTAWDASYYYQLPDDILPGRHTLRVSLRGNDHHALGIEDSVEIDVVSGVLQSEEPLIDVNSWSFQSAGEDSLAAHRPGSVDCPGNSWVNEEGALEVETGYCNYLSVAQASLAEVNAGDTLHLVLWHGNLVFEDTATATAHVAITLDGNTVWEEEVDIPGSAEIFDVRIPAGFDAPAGSKVEYHLHNHGYNTWTLLKLDVERTIQ